MIVAASRAARYLEGMAFLRGAAVAVTTLVLLVACGGTDDVFPENAFAVPANRDIAVGEERLLVGVRIPDGTSLGGPETPVDIAVAPEGSPDDRQSARAEFSWIVPDGIGLYRARFTFDEPGTWVVVVTPVGGEPLEPSPFVVLPDNVAPSVGEPAPPAPTPTLDDGTFEQITSDPDPDPRFYELSLEEALDNGNPTVLVFATPAFCQTAACGPLLQNVKEVAPGYPDVNFLHVEVYTGLQEPDFAPDSNHLAEAVTPAWWNLPSEPFGFVIDEAGVIVARFEGTLDPVELIPYLGPPSE